jgi:hypothetical protein
MELARMVVTTTPGPAVVPVQVGTGVWPSAPSVFSQPCHTKGEMEKVTGRPVPT